MSPGLPLVALISCLAACGCATHPAATATTGPVAAKPTSPPPGDARPLDPRALVPLEDIPPRPRLAARNTASSDEDPPIAAVRLFAQARIAVLDNERFTAINLLEKAAAADPQSFQIREALGKLYQENSASDERSVAAFEEAAAIDPDHLELQVNLGRQYLTQGKAREGVAHLLLALQTTGYRSDQSSAAEAELFLSTALRQQGYLSASLMLLERLSARISNAGMAVRSKPALRVLLEHPEEVTLQIAELQQKLRNYPDALKSYMTVAAADPTNLDLQQRVVEVLGAMGRHPEAIQLASNLVLEHQAREPSVTILRTATQSTGGDPAASDELGRLYAAHPTMRSLLFAQIALLRSSGRNAQADAALSRSVAAHPDDLDLTFRQFDLLAQQPDRLPAARFLIHATARHPEWTPEAAQSFETLLRGTTAGHLRVTDLQSLSLAKTDDPARLYWTYVCAAFWHRDGLAHDAIEQAAKTSPPFRPAYRAALQQQWEISDAGSNAGQGDGAAALVARAATADPGLAAELRGLILLHQHDNTGAIAQLAASLKLPGVDADLQLEYAEALRTSGDESGFEAAMWKLLSDHPLYHGGYVELYGYYATKGSEPMIDRVISTWVSADPDSVGAARLQARAYFRANRPDAAEAIMSRMLAQRGDDAEVLATLRAFYVETGRPDSLPRRLEDRLAHDPGNFAAVTVLAELYADGHREADALRVLDSFRAFADKDVDLLYSLSGLYARIDQKQPSEQLLRTVLQLDPNHAAAGNDLGYLLTEDGRDLPRAESLIRKAVLAEPFNLSFLDSLGWVLYKLGRFDEARSCLERATVGEQADPVVLNHLGDDAYRLGDKQLAAKSWKQAEEHLAGVDEHRDDLKGLRQQLQMKQQHLAAGGDVDVAPIAPPASTAPQATR